MKTPRKTLEKRAGHVRAICVALAFAASSALVSTSVSAADNSLRVSRGVLVLYDFDFGSGSIVRDRSGTGEPLDLKISDEKSIQWQPDGLAIRGKTQIRSEKPAAKLIDGFRRSGELTIEAWVKPANELQDGPARIVTLSKNTGERNFTLGQEGNRYDARLRTSKTSINGLPSLSSPSNRVNLEKTHLVFTRDRSGQTRMYVGGEQIAAGRAAGEPTNWSSYQLALANELTGDRPWQGTLYLVAMYDVALTPAEVQQNYQAGSQASLSPEQLAARNKAQSEELFVQQVAPLLIRSCFECHDAASKQGGLNLQRKTAALAGGESGSAILPGEPDQSLLWQSVVSGDMPQKRTPLTSEEQGHLRRWIETGAAWPFEVIDPAVHAQGGRAAQRTLQRLTVSEYIETVRSTVGVDIAKEAEELLPPDLRADGFSNTAYNLNVDLKHVDAYARLAETIVSRMDVAAFVRKFTQSRKPAEKELRKLIADLGQPLLRGPLSEDEVTNYLRITQAVAAAGGDFDEAMQYVLEAMLQSPRFIYRIENQQATGQASSYELATRMSYILWGGPPDAELLEAAGQRTLGNKEQVAAQVRRMLKDPRAVARSREFVEEWLHLERLDALQPNPKRYPQWNSDLAADMRAETLAFFEELAWKQERSLAELFNAQFTFATPRLAAHYGLPVQKSSRPDELTRYDLAKVPGLGGLLTQGSVLTVGGDEASMVARGLFVLHDVLRGTVQDPPPCVDTTPVPTKTGLTQRGIAQQRIANQACGGCHARFEPLAFGLEKYDGLGAYRETDAHRNKLRDDGEVLVPGAEAPLTYNTAAELMDLLAGSHRVQETITWKLTQFALGRPLVGADAAIVEEIHNTAEQNGGTYQALVTAIVLSDLVQMSAPPGK